jgi:hypothetical protein
VKSFALQTSDSTSSIVPTGSSPPTNKTVLADSAATGHFFHSSALLTNVRPVTPSTRIAVKVFNDEIIHSSHIGELNIPLLLAAARIAMSSLAFLTR